MVKDEERRDGGESAAAWEGRGPRVAMVTGGSRGIGRAVVEALLGAGYRVFFGSRSLESVDRALAELRQHPGAQGAQGSHGSHSSQGFNVAGRQLDVRRQDQVDAFV
ncbi:MAG TPA: SDR family NAD(P)-dependent oxidoreductase, partial [Thermoanaerobaculia bacterium]|nr:SDR family NAD(P)-dependent oxidoreductase [Thermoanaerobaculia bacterium]